MKKNKEFAIISASDSRYGDFLINHWLKSLIKNVNLELIDVVILNYGLTEKQKKDLLDKKVKVIDCIRDGHIVNIRYRDLLRFLKKNKYKQILFCDSGDIIFQRDIAPFFQRDSNNFRVVFENMKSNFIEYLLAQDSFPPKIKKNIINILKGKKIINGGVVFAPYSKLKKLCNNMISWINNKDIYGPDQVILNYTLYKEGFIPLNTNLNYVVENNSGFKIRKGVFFDKNNETIFVVHNSGSYDILRAVKNFGYGPDYNKMSWTTYILFRLFIKLKLFNIPKYFILFKKIFIKK